MTCFNCGQEHDDPPQKCPLVKAYRYYPDGSLAGVEFVTFADMGGAFQLVNIEADVPPGTTVQ